MQEDYEESISLTLRVGNTNGSSYALQDLEEKQARGNPSQD